MGARPAPVLQARARDSGVQRLRPRPPRRRGEAPPRLRTALVTGASSGIGAATAARLAANGWRVLAGVRDVTQAPPGTEPVRLDVTSGDEIGSLSEIGELEALVNNAGIAIAAPVELLPLDELRHQLEVNVVGQVAITQALLPALRARRGRIVFVSSIAGYSALPFLSAYAASKHAIEAIADSLRIEVAPWGIGVTVIEPGSIRTPMWQRAGAHAEQLAEHAGERGGLYAERAAAFGAIAARRGANGAPVEAVAATIERALTTERPRTRYLVGRDAHIRAAIEHLPDRLRDRVYERLLLRS